MTDTGQDISRAAEILRQGGLVAIPTETVYGLAADALQPKAVARIFEVKNRPHFDPLIVHLYDRNGLEQYCKNIPPLFDKLYQKFCPGPLTFVLPRTPRIPDIVTSGQDTVAVRFPRQSLTRELLRVIDRPLAAPSANPFGYISPTRPRHVQEQLGDKIDYLLDGGSCRVGIESTIIDLSRREPAILRLGGISTEDIKLITGKVNLQLTARPGEETPGQISTHYAPHKPLILGEVDKELAQRDPKRCGLLSYRKTYREVPLPQQQVVSPLGDLAEAASYIFMALHRLDKMDIDVILAEEFPEEGLGRAINDRLRRAAARTGPAGK